jgi:hypothetical protein
MPYSKAGPRSGRTKPQMGADKRDVQSTLMKRQPKPQGGRDKRDGVIPRPGRGSAASGKGDKSDVAGVEKKRQPKPQGGADKRDVAGVSQRSRVTSRAPGDKNLSRVTSRVTKKTDLGRTTSTVTKKAPAKKAASNRTPGVLPRMGVKAEGKVGTGIRATEWAYRKAARAGKMRKAGKNAATNRRQGQLESKAGRGKVR